MRLPLLRRRDPRPQVNFLHLGKTGGTALAHALVPHIHAASHFVIFRGHDVTLDDIRRGQKLMFVLRDPLTRFVSAFNGRLREDRPRYVYPWRDEERVAFAVFKTPDQLATALSSPDDTERERAEQAMRGIGHVNTPYSFWFGDEERFRSRLGDVFFIAFQERLDQDFDLLKRRLALPPELRLPADETAAHRTPAGFSTELGDVARRNLARWYAQDISFVRLCRELAPEINRLPDAHAEAGSSAA